MFLSDSQNGDSFPEQHCHWFLRSWRRVSTTRYELNILIEIRGFEPFQDCTKYLYQHNIALYDVLIFSPSPTPGWKTPSVGRPRLFSCTVAVSIYNSVSPSGPEDPWIHFCNGYNESYVYWTVHHCDIWRIKDQLDVTCCFISLLMYSTCFGH